MSLKQAFWNWAGIFALNALNAAAILIEGKGLWLLFIVAPLAAWSAFACWLVSAMYHHPERFQR